MLKIKHKELFVLNYQLVMLGVCYKIIINKCKNDNIYKEIFLKTKERVRNKFDNWRRVFVCLQGVAIGA